MLKHKTMSLRLLSCVAVAALASSCSGEHDSNVDRSNRYCSIIKKEWPDDIRKLDGNQQNVKFYLRKNQLTLDERYKDGDKSPQQVLEYDKEVTPKPILILKIIGHNTCSGSLEKLRSLRSSYECKYMECFLVR
jgi:hypothetical protein